MFSQRIESFTLRDTSASTVKFQTEVMPVNRIVYGTYADSIWKEK